MTPDLSYELVGRRDREDVRKNGMTKKKKTHTHTRRECVYKCPHRVVAFDLYKNEIYKWGKPHRPKSKSKKSHHKQTRDPRRSISTDSDFSFLPTRDLSFR